MTYYYDEDYSLSEISEITGISRQGIRDSVKKSEAELREMEEKLHFAARIQVLDSSLTQLTAMLRDIAENCADTDVQKAVYKAIHSAEQIVF